MGNITQETFLEHFAAWLARLRQQKIAQRETAAVLKRAKLAGVDARMFPALQRMRDEDKGERDARARRLAEYMAMLRIEPSPQLDLFEADPSARAQAMLSQLEATEAGFEAGSGGEPRGNNPHPAGSEHFVTWDQGWIDGQAALAAQMALSGDGEKVERRGKRGKREMDRAMGAA